MNSIQPRSQTKEEEEEENNKRHENRVELRLGSILSEKLTTTSFEFTACAMEDTKDEIFQSILNSEYLITCCSSLMPPAGFIDPWSLAARQQKAALEQALKKYPTATSSSFPQHLQRETKGSASAIIGWPPICSFRRNMATTSKATRSNEKEDDERKAKRSKIGGYGEACFDAYEKNVMFVKVNMEGYAVGRKIDLRAHTNYDSLSLAIKKMFHNFLSVDYPNTLSSAETSSSDYLLLYEDHEGDRMLVGDVPWEMFVTSVRRLYIVRIPKSPHRLP